MNSLHFLEAAYAVAWIIYLGYLARILLRMRRVQQEICDLAAASQVSIQSANSSTAVPRQ